MNRFYFDHNATTPVSGEVLDLYLPVLTQAYGNASSIHHFGQDAKRRLEVARKQVAWMLNADPKQIVFLSGGTEANNLSILGVVRRSRSATRHVITTAIEHPAVLNACAQLEREGVEVTYLPVGASGVLDPDEVKRALRPETVLISVMHVNNETGTIQPIDEVARIATEAEVVFHSDGVQAPAKLPLNDNEPPADLYSLSAHKFYGPKGVGA
ncbi:MAG: cysteine desulfurase, partial [bacterium]|nr:cysteine desulfurase [bacterium]